MRILRWNNLSVLHPDASLCMQAMDRCHRIGQQKPVLVLRLTTAHSTDGKMLAGVRTKLALERILSRRAAFFLKWCVRFR